MRLAVGLLLLVAAAAALEIEWLSAEQVVVFKDAHGQFRSAKNDKACERALRTDGSTKKIRWAELTAHCTAERSGQIGTARFALDKQPDGSLLACIGTADVRSLSLRAGTLRFSTLGAGVKGGNRERSSGRRAEWSVPYWRTVEFDDGTSMTCSIRAPARAASPESSKLDAPLAMAKKTKSKHAELGRSPAVVPIAAKYEGKAKKATPPAKIKVNRNGCVAIPVPSGHKLHIDNIDLCIANKKEAVCENVYPAEKVSQTGAQVCVPNLRELVSEMHDRSALVVKAEPSSRVQLQIGYTLDGASPIYNLRGIAPLGTATAKSVSKVLAASECDADSCDVDSADDSGDWVVVTPVSNWVLITVIIVSGALFLVLIYFLVASAFRVNDQRTSKRRGE